MSTTGDGCASYGGNLIEESDEGTLRSVDLNAHITNIRSRVVVRDSTAEALITFDNLGYGDVVAVKLKARGYDSFGDPFLVGGGKEFLLIIQDFKVPKNSPSDALTAKLPSFDIRRLELEEYQVCYSDGSVTSYAGADSRDVAYTPFSEGEDAELSAAIKWSFRNGYEYLPLEIEGAWLCSCGRLNPERVENCMKCEHSKSEVFDAIDPSHRDDLVEKHALWLDAEKKRAKEREELLEKKKKLLKKYGAFAAAAVIVIAGLIFLISDHASRSHFSSESEMKESIEGVYTSENDLWMIKVEDGKVTERLLVDGSEDYELDIETYDYAAGKFTAGYREYEVLSNGDIYYEGLDNVYEKGGYWTPGSGYQSSSKSTQYESVYTALSITGHISRGSNYTYYEGKITNNGSKTYRYVEVKGSFKNSSGTVVDTDWTYAVGSEGLSPGESKTFQLSVPKDSSISTCSVSILDYS